MKVRIYLGRILFSALLIVIGFVLQTSLFNHLELAGVVPNILLALTSLAGFIRGRREGMIFGLFSGLVLDFFSGQLFGTYMLLYLLIGFLNGLFRRSFFGDDIKLPLLFIGVSDLFYGFLIYLVSFLIRGRKDIQFYFLSIMAPEAVYTVVVSILIYIPVFLINNRLEQYEKKEVRKLG